jgi:hypothetical protein
MVFQLQGLVARAPFPSFFFKIPGKANIMAFAPRCIAPCTPKRFCHAHS